MKWAVLQKVEKRKKKRVKPLKSSKWYFKELQLMPERSLLLCKNLKALFSPKQHRSNLLQIQRSWVYPFSTTKQWRALLLLLRNLKLKLNQDFVSNLLEVSLKFNLSKACLICNFNRFRKQEIPRTCNLLTFLWRLIKHRLRTRWLRLNWQEGILIWTWRDK